MFYLRARSICFSLQALTTTSIMLSFVLNILIICFLPFLQSAKKYDIIFNVNLKLGVTDNENISSRRS